MEVVFLFFFYFNAKGCNELRMGGQPEMQTHFVWREHVSDVTIHHVGFVMILRQSTSYTHCSLYSYASPTHPPPLHCITQVRCVYIWRRQLFHDYLRSSSVSIPFFFYSFLFFRYKTVSMADARKNKRTDNDGGSAPSK